MGTEASAVSIRVPLTRGGVPHNLLTEVDHRLPVPVPLLFQQLYLGHQPFLLYGNKIHTSIDLHHPLHTSTVLFVNSRISLYGQKRERGEPGEGGGGGCTPLPLLRSLSFRVLPFLDQSAFSSQQPPAGGASQPPHASASPHRAPAVLCCISPLMRPHPCPSPPPLDSCSMTREYASGTIPASIP